MKAKQVIGELYDALTTARAWVDSVCALRWQGRIGVGPKEITARALLRRLRKAQRRAYQSASCLADRGAP